MSTPPEHPSSDRVIVYRTGAGTTTSINTNNHNDFLFIGSTAGQDNGDLGQINGPLSLIGGSNDPGGEDRLLVNDRGASGDFGYRVGPTYVVDNTIPARSGFAGIRYDASIELVRFEASDGQNTVEVTPGFHPTICPPGNPEQSIGPKKARLPNYRRQARLI